MKVRGTSVTKVEIARYVVECMRREDTPRASELAAQFGVTASHLSRTFRARYGVALSDYMKALQVRRAQKLLRTTELDTTRIAYACGFGTRRTFFRAYRRMTGDSPLTYRRWTTNIPPIGPRVSLRFARGRASVTAVRHRRAVRR
jgi:transcriptional regulator GlxA family with amidase domain